MAILHVTEVEVTNAESHELAVTFDDGTRRRVELGGLLNGCFEPLRDPQAFAQVYMAPPGVPTWPTKVRPEGVPEEDAMQLNPAPEALKEAPSEDLPRKPAAARA
jgi:hypothetical protein